MAKDAAADTEERDHDHYVFDPYPEGSHIAGGAPIYVSGKISRAADVPSSMIHKERSIGTIGVAEACAGRTRPVLELTMEDMIPEDPLPAHAQTGHARTGETTMPPASIGTGAGRNYPAYAPMQVLDAEGRPTRPSGPVMDRRDVYRLVMAHRRLDPRTSSAIMDAAGAGRTHANPMLNHGRPGNDVSLAAVARLYGIETGFTPGRGIDPSWYEGMDPCDVIGPGVLSASEAGRLGSLAQKEPVRRKSLRTRRKSAGDQVHPRSERCEACGEGERSGDGPEDHEELIDRLDRTTRNLARLMLEAKRREAHANARAEEAEYLAKKAKAAAIASEMRAVDAEALLEEARGTLLDVRDMLARDRNDVSRTG